MRHDSMPRGCNVQDGYCHCAHTMFLTCRYAGSVHKFLKAVSKVSRFGIEMNVEHENSYLPEDLLFHCITQWMHIQQKNLPDTQTYQAALRYLETDCRGIQDDNRTKRCCQFVDADSRWTNRLLPLSSITAAETDVLSRFGLPAGSLEVTPSHILPLLCEEPVAMLTVSDLWRSMTKHSSSFNHISKHLGAYEELPLGACQGLHWYITIQSASPSSVSFPKDIR